MDVFEITGLQTGVSRSGVNYLQAKDSFQNIENGFIYRQVLQSRRGISLFTPRLDNETRIYGIFEHILPNGSTQLLAFDANFLYLYNTSTNAFDQIPFGGSMAAYPGFALVLKDGYISGASYPIAPLLSNGAANPEYILANLGARFIFTGSQITPNANGSAIFFFNGTDVRDFTNIVDNPNYQAPLINGVSTALIRAKYVFWFGERLNFLHPTIGGVVYPQAVLYSGIRTVIGNGDKFAISGSGMLQADTSESMNGASILGQIIIMNFSRSNWTLEKTRDAFNPYFIRKVPSVLGTNADYSAVSWNDTVRSIGKTGLIGTDGRQSLRVDNKIPYFTADEIDPIEFNLTYGGFDRLNNQFLWSYARSDTTATSQDRVLVNNYEEETWSVYDLRLSVFGQTDLGDQLTWDNIEAANDPSWVSWDTTEEIWDKIGIGESIQKTLAGDDLGFIYQLNQDGDDFVTNITGVTNATEAVLAVDASAFKAGDEVVVEGVVGVELSGDSLINNYDPEVDDPDFLPWTIISATTTSITLDADTFNGSAYISGGRISKVINFSAETIPFNPYREIGRRCFVSYVEFLIDTTGGFLKIDVYEDEETTPFKENVLVYPTGTRKGREWVTMSIDNEANFHTFVLKQKSPAVQVKVTSIRIHCQPGGLTSG